MNKNRIPPSKECRYCKKTFLKPKTESLKDWVNRHKYCSRKCKDDDLIGKPSWNKGLHNWWTPNPKGIKRKMSLEWRKKLSDSAKRTWNEKWTKEEQEILRKKQIITRRLHGNFKGTLGKTEELSAVWLGDKATYNTKHRWIQKHWVKTGICESCKTKPKPYGRRKQGTEWHNINRNYDRKNREDWIELCPKCHRLFDK
jgi:hypothetical protein